MKKVIILLVVTICTSSFILNAATDLKLNLEKGKVYKLKSEFQQTISETFNGTPMNIEMTNLAVIEVIADSLMPDYLIATVKFDSIKTSMDMPMQSVKINTNKTGNLKNPAFAMNNAMSVLVKNPLKVKFSYTGKVLEIRNASAINDSAVKVFDSLPEPTKNQMLPMVKMSMNYESLRSMLLFFSYFPDKSVKEGDKWESSYTITPNGMELTVKTKYKLKSITDGKASITGDVTIESAENGTANMGGMQMPFELRGLGSSDLTVDTNTGVIISGKTKQKLQGSITFNGNAMPMNIESNIQTEALK